MYEKIKNLINEDKKLRNKVLRLINMDKSLEKEDVIANIYVKMTEENLNFERKVINNLINRMVKNAAKNYHLSFKEDIYICDKYSNFLDNDNVIKKMIELSKKIGLTEEEELIILYIKNKKNIKKFNYDFCYDKRKKQMNVYKLNKYLSQIVQKLIKYISKSIIEEITET